MLKLAYNTTDTPTVDGQGYSIGGRSWGGADTTDEITQADFDAGRLILADEDAAEKAADSPDVDPDIKHAVKALKARRERVKKAKELDKDELLELADPDVVATLEVGASGEPSKADLVEAVAGDPEALDDAAAPVPAPKKSTSRASAAAKK